MTAATAHLAQRALGRRRHAPQVGVVGQVELDRRPPGIVERQAVVCGAGKGEAFAHRAVSRVRARPGTRRRGVRGQRLGVGEPADIVGQRGCRRHGRPPATWSSARNRASKGPSSSARHPPWAARGSRPSCSRRTPPNCWRPTKTVPALRNAASVAVARLIAHDQQQVLGRPLVRELDARARAMARSRSPPRAASARRTMSARGVARTSVSSACSTAPASASPTSPHRHGQHRGVGIVLGLRQHLARHDDRRRALSSASTSSSLGPGRRIDGDLRDQLQLGFGHVGVAGTDDAIDARNGVGAQRHAPRWRPRRPRRTRDPRSPARRRRARPRDGSPSGPGGEQTITSRTPATRAGIAPMSKRARIGRASARRVDAHALQRIGPTPDGDAGLGRHHHRLRQERRGAPSRCCAPRAPGHCRTSGSSASSACVQRDRGTSRAVERHAVELARERAQRRVTVTPHAIDDRRRARADLSDRATRRGR